MFARGVCDDLSRGDAMTQDDDFEPRLGKIRSRGSKRGQRYLHRVLCAVALAGGIRHSGASPRRSTFNGSRIGRGAGVGRVLAGHHQIPHRQTGRQRHDKERRRICAIPSAMASRGTVSPASSVRPTRIGRTERGSSSASTATATSSGSSSPPRTAWNTTTSSRSSAA
jgi:hypothetical protein